jgi:hypothetical protein
VLADFWMRFGFTNTFRMPSLTATWWWDLLAESAMIAGLSSGLPLW